MAIASRYRALLTDRKCRRKQNLLENLESRVLLSTFSNSTSITIPATGTSGIAIPYPSQIVVSDLPGSVFDVNVTLKGFTHTYPDDIDVLLVGPGGQKIILMSDSGGSSNINAINLTLDDSAPTSLPDASLLATGTYKPTNFGSGDSFSAPAPAGPYASTLAAFDGTDPNGTWSLYVVDDSSADVGTIAAGWELIISAGTPIDYGDAPAPYPTLLANNGPAHTILPGFRLGNAIDNENDGQPNPNATGDDITGPLDDEDGVIFTSPLVAGFSASVSVNASASGLLNAWVDFNSDGDWLDPDEQIFTDTPLAPGINSLSFDVPSTITSLTYARFRFSSAGGLSFVGPAPDGEVEDYALGVISGSKWNDLNGDGAWQTASEPGLPGTTVYLDLNHNSQFDAAEPSALTAADGGYAIGGLPPGTYQVAEVVAPGWDPTYPTARTFGTPLVNVPGQGYSSVRPPDPVGDVGPAHFVQATNASNSSNITIYNKADGSVAVPQFLLSSLAAGATGSSPYTGRGDPIVVYDHLAARWLLMEFETTGNEIDIFISDTSTPTGNGADWTQYRINATNFPDYHKLTVWPDAYLLGTNETDNPVYALNRNAMLSGAGGLVTTIRRSTTDRPNWPFNHTMPVHADGPTPPPAGEPGLFIRQVDDELTNPGGADPSFDFLELWAFHPDFVTPANSTYSLAQSIPIADFALVDISLDDVPQPGTTQKLDSLDDVFMWRPQYRNFGAYQTLVGNFAVDDASTGPGQTGIRWFELRKSGAGPWSLYQENTLAPDATHRWNGAIAMDGAGNIALAYNVSSSSVYPGIRYSGRLAGDPLGTLPWGEYTLIDGASSQTANNRWGDYSSMSIDSVDDSTFWFTGEYLPAGGNWATRIGAFAFGEPGTQVPHAVSLTDGAALTAVNFGNHQAPVVTITSPTVYVLTATPTITGIAGILSTDLPAVTVIVYSGSSPSGTPLLTLTASADPGTGAYTVTVPAGSPLPQGQYTIQASQADTTGSIGYSAPTTFVVYTLPGDANADGTVSFNDFVILANNFGSPTLAGPGAGDFNGDGAVTFLDFVILSNNFGQTVTPASQVVIPDQPPARTGTIMSATNRRSPTLPPTRGTAWNAGHKTRPLHLLEHPAENQGARRNRNPGGGFS